MFDGNARQMRFITYEKSQLRFIPGTDRRLMFTGDLSNSYSGVFKVVSSASHLINPFPNEKVNFVNTLYQSKERAVGVDSHVQESRGRKRENQAMYERESLRQTSNGKRPLRSTKLTRE